MKSRLDAIKAANPVLEVQFNLRDIAQVNPDIPMIIPTGTYDPQTQTAISEFQRLFNLPVTGNVDYTTWIAINKEHNVAMNNINTPSSVFCFPDSIKEYKKDDKCDFIYILQIILRGYHKKYRNYLDVPLTGIYDEQTEAAIKQFQKCSNLPVTGRLDRQTWNILNKINETCKLYE